MAELEAEEQRLLKTYELEGADWKKVEEHAVPEGMIKFN